jgi:tetratricopeptide (TPR) repeat protein
MKYSGQKLWEKGKAALERALRLQLDALGEQHPATAATLASLGTTYGDMGDQGSAIMLAERALRIYKDTLGPHPATARTMSSMGAAYGEKGQSKEAIELFQLALRIYESTVGRKHRDVALAIFNMSTAYAKLGNFARAEELGLEAEKIYAETLGKDHKKMFDDKLRRILDGSAQLPPQLHLGEVAYSWANGKSEEEGTHQPGFRQLTADELRQLTRRLRAAPQHHVVFLNLCGHKMGSDVMQEMAPAIATLNALQVLNLNCNYYVCFF